VALTESKIKDLKEKKFDKLYTKHKEAWHKMVHDDFQFAKTHITNGNRPRQDDVLKVLLPQLEVSEDLRKHQEDHKARYKRFREYFGEYIIDKYYETLPAEVKSE
jgi:hypothetical protein